MPTNVRIIGDLLLYFSHLTVQIGYYPIYIIEQTSSKHQAGLKEPRPLAQM